MKTNNYETWCKEWQERFLTLNQEQLLKKIPGLREEGDHLVLLYYQRRYGISRHTGEILSLEGKEKPSLFTRLNIYTLLWYCKEQARPDGEWLPFRSLKNASPFGPAFQRTVVDVCARTFSGHQRELEEACQKLGGKKLPHSDAGYELPAFECIPVRFLFWDGDDEFPAQANILFDKNAVDFIHVESLVSIASEALTFLSEASGLPLLGNTFV
ncbi:MAG: DUF3786 domain-containing protein [Lachnospiraceae bacterium]|nr:DUF3786 domain-containing protein [Lachnospiraceae bacterium]